MSGETRELRKSPWYDAPATESPAPIATAATMRGSRMSYTSVATVARGTVAPVTEAIERHRDYPLAAGSPILDAVVAANYVAKTIGVGLGAEGLNMKIDNSCLKRLGLDFEGFCRLCAKTAARMAELRKAYGLS